MLYIKADGQDYTFFREIEERYSDIIVSDSKNFDGSSEIVEVFISLTPIVLSSLTIILHDILSYMKSRHKDDSKKQNEEISKEYQWQKTNLRSPMDESARKPQQYLAEVGVIT